MGVVTMKIGNIKKTIKKIAFKCYALINMIPFNNKKKGRILVENKGTILRGCRIISKGKNNQIVFSGGVF